jgi:dihydroorotate dehydrogenase
LADLDRLKINRPIFLKISPDIPFNKIDEIISLAEQYNITGLICTNLTKNRNLINPTENALAPPDRGGISGKPLAEAADKMIAYVYQKTGGKKIIIGCGGIFNAEDAYKKIKLGASLLQLITGMIFEGPQVISQINLGLVELLKKDGYKNISEAVGADFKN